MPSCGLLPGVQLSELCIPRSGLHSHSDACLGLSNIYCSTCDKGYRVLGSILGPSFWGNTGLGLYTSIYMYVSMSIVG